MRYSLLLAALAAGCVNAAEKQVIVTDWSQVVVTETVTAPAVTETLPPVEKQQVVYETETEQPAAPATTEQSELAKKSTVVVEDTQTSTHEAPAPVQSVFSTAWTSSWEILPTTQAEQPQPATTTAQPASSTLATSTSSAQPESTGANAYQQAVLYNHNIHRSNHSSPSVDWDDKLKESAHVLAARCVYEHDT